MYVYVHLVLNQREVAVKFTDNFTLYEALPVQSSRHINDTRALNQVAGFVVKTSKNGSGKSKAP